SYGKKYGCKKVALIYPRTSNFKEQIYYHFDDELSLYCFPFDVDNPEGSVTTITDKLQTSRCSHPT
ncbi:MAG: hypothetical protein OXE03_10040, partial [Gammaproteobacteria bacterium]|nr:hypothetical protein [Gammaproteobacteria bacterium]